MTWCYNLERFCSSGKDNICQHSDKKAPYMHAICARRCYGPSYVWRVRYTRKYANSFTKQYGLKHNRIYLIYKSLLHQCHDEGLLTESQAVYLLNDTYMDLSVQKIRLLLPYWHFGFLAPWHILSSSVQGAFSNYFSGLQSSFTDKSLENKQLVLPLRNHNKYNPLVYEEQ